SDFHSASAAAAKAARNNARKRCLRNRTMGRAQSKGADKKLRQKSAPSHLARMPKYARVLVDDSAGKAFDYELPEAVAGLVQPGSRVRVPVRTRTMLATIIELLDSTDVAGVKLISEVVSAEPILSPLLLRLGAW